MTEICVFDVQTERQAGNLQVLGLCKQIHISLRVELCALSERSVSQLGDPDKEARGFYISVTWQRWNLEKLMVS